MYNWTIKINLQHTNISIMIQSRNLKRFARLKRFVFCICFTNVLLDIMELKKPHKFYFQISIWFIYILDKNLLSSWKVNLSSLNIIFQQYYWSNICVLDGVCPSIKTSFSLLVLQNVQGGAKKVTEKKEITTLLIHGLYYVN